MKPIERVRRLEARKGYRPSCWDMMGLSDHDLVLLEAIRDRPETLTKTESKQIAAIMEDLRV